MDDFFGAPTSKIDDPLLVDLKNEFDTFSTRSVQDMAQSNRVIPRQVTTGVLRGTQRIVNTDGSFITLGVLPDGNGEFGIGYYDAAGTRQKVETSETRYLYDTQGNISYADGYLIAGEEPIVIIVKEGYDALESVES
jgi:hypothetical protein